MRQKVAGAIVLGALATACGTNATTATQASSATANPVAGSGQRSSEPAIIGQAIAGGKTDETTPSATQPQPKQPKATTSNAAQPTTTAAPTPTATASAAPTPTPATKAPVGQGGADPSGQTPATTLSGFTRKYVQEFAGDRLPSNWGEYLGVPGGESAQTAQWEPGMCTFSGGEAHFMASGIDSCGMHYLGRPQQYGAWFARLQATPEPTGQLFSDIFLLWPANAQWPPEIDVYEDEGDRSRTVATLWNTVGDACGASPTSHCLGQYVQGNGESDGIANSDTEWHTYGVEWTPAGVSWLIDGRVICTAPANAVKSPARQPALAMNLALQSQNLSGAGSPTLRDTMNVDWVEQFTWNG